MFRVAPYLAIVACGSPPAPAKPPPPVAVAVAVVPAIDERARHDELAAAHRVIEEEQQDALAATCDNSVHHDAHERCLPSCYPTEPADPRAGKKLTGAVEIRHLVCEPETAAGGGPFVLADELDGAKLTLRPARGRFPHGHKKGTWQATLETALADVHVPKLARGDVLLVAGDRHELAHPLTKERLRCVTVSHFTTLRRALDGCGADGALACEATGNAATRAINVVHYRLAEARALQTASKSTECQQAALEAIAVAHGLPRWRQYTKLNVRTWIDHPGYRTRFDGTLDEDQLVAATDALGKAAHEVYVACGGAASATTTVAQEQSFHTCW